MRTIAIAKFYADRVAFRAGQAANDAQMFVAENKSEMIRTGAIVSVVYLASRAAGFNAGYQFATS